MQNKHWNKEAI